MTETIGILLKIIGGVLILSTAAGRREIPYTQNTEIDISYKGERLTIEELIRKRVKVIQWEDGTRIEIKHPKDE
jgi:hypothetical protein